MSFLAVASLLAGLAGTAIQQKEAADNRRREREAVNRVLEENRIQQDRFTEEAQLQLSDVLSRYAEENAKPNLEEEQQELGDQFVKNLDKEITFEGAPASAPKNVLIASKNESDKLRANSEQRARTLAALAAFGQRGFENNINLTRGSQKLGRTVSKASGQQGLVPIEIQSARRNSQKKPSIFGPLLQAIGSAGSIYSGAGGTLFGSATPNYTAGIQGGNGFLVGGV